jgi:surface antigen
MKKIVTIGATIVMTAGLVGCTPGNNIPGATIAGTAAGGLLGAALFEGSGAWIGILGGALIGGVIGNFVGKKMDENDRERMAHAIIVTPVGEEVTWTNSHEVTYIVRPIHVYHHHHHYCREYQTTVIIGGQQKKAFGRACRMPDGQWKMVS